MECVSRRTEVSLNKGVYIVTGTDTLFKAYTKNEGKLFIYKGFKCMFTESQVIVRDEFGSVEKDLEYFGGSGVISLNEALESCCNDLLYASDNVRQVFQLLGEKMIKSDIIDTLHCNLNDFPVMLLAKNDKDLEVRFHYSQVTYGKEYTVELLGKDEDKNMTYSDNNCENFDEWVERVEKFVNEYFKDFEDVNREIDFFNAMNAIWAEFIKEKGRV